MRATTDKKKKSGGLRAVLQFVKPHLALVILGIVFALVGVSCALLTPILIGKAVDCAVGAGKVDFDALAKYLLYTMLVVVVGALFMWLMNLVTNKTAYATVRDMRRAIFEKLCRAPLSKMDSLSRGDVLSRMISDIDKISDGLLQGFTQLFTGVITICGTIGFMLMLSAPITLVVVLITPLSMLTAALITKRSHKMFIAQAQANGELGGFAEEMLTGQRVVKAFGYERVTQEKFEAINAKLYDSGIKSQFASSISNPATRFVNGIVYAAVGVCGALAVMGHFGESLTIGQLSGFLAYANQYSKPFNEITSVITELQAATAASARVVELLNEAEEQNDDSAETITDCSGRIEIDNVCFSYNPAIPLIENFNLSVKPGEKVAIVGPTGCGKTTFINLLMRFYDIDSGRIQVDGVNIYRVNRSGVRKLYGMVLQDSWLFAGTVRENIAYGKPDATDDEIVAAAKAAHAHGFIKKLQYGYDTVLSESGDNLSQGQKQLLSIARVMLVSPPMLILDEATSSIDTRTEQKIQEAFARLMEGKTSFVVAHRLSTIKEADKILVMNRGKILEQGTHEQLLRKGGFYASLYNSQFEGRS